MAESDIAVELLKDIRDEIRGARSELRDEIRGVRTERIDPPDAARRARVVPIAGAGAVVLGACLWLALRDGDQKVDPQSVAVEAIHRPAAPAPAAPPPERALPAVPAIPILAPTPAVASSPAPRAAPRKVPVRHRAAPAAEAELEPAKL
jgi:hypothetical protein